MKGQVIPNKIAGVFRMLSAIMLAIVFIGREDFRPIHLILVGIAVMVFLDGIRLYKTPFRRPPLPQWFSIIVFGSAIIIIIVWKGTGKV